MMQARAEAIRGSDWIPLDGQGGRHGSCSTEFHEGREAVMPGVGLEIDLAECEDLCSLQEDFDYGKEV